MVSRKNSKNDESEITEEEEQILQQYKISNNNNKNHHRHNNKLNKNDKYLMHNVNHKQRQEMSSLLNLTLLFFASSLTPIISS
jgi:hypothetical protein